MSDTDYAQTGSLSEKYESGGDPGVIGYDSVGGYSYGAYQLAHDNARKFIVQSSYARKFDGLEFNSQGWRDKWMEVAAADREGFKDAQRSYIENKFFAPQMNKLTAAGIDTSPFSHTLCNVIWSTAVQHGANTDVVENAFRKVEANASEAVIIRSIYEERWGGGQRFISSSEGVRKSVYNRFFGPGGEMNTALAQLV